MTARRGVTHGGVLKLDLFRRPRGVRNLEHVRPEGMLGWLFDALNLITVPLFDDHFNRRTAQDARGSGLFVERVERRACGIVQLILCRV